MPLRVLMVRQQINSFIEKRKKKKQKKIICSCVLHFFLQTFMCEWYQNNLVLQNATCFFFNMIKQFNGDLHFVVTKHYLNWGKSKRSYSGLKHWYILLAHFTDYSNTHLQKVNFLHVQQHCSFCFNIETLRFNLHLR